MTYLKLPIVASLALFAWVAMLATMSLAVLVGAPLMRLNDFLKAKAARETLRLQRLSSSASRRQESTQF